ncbi:MAG TPA: penicillin-binding protein, partial [Rhodospirillaceae bacterium]|nr:penicillin-binding protein [Rhodospirillaceae bacterium]
MLRFLGWFLFLIVLGAAAAAGGIFYLLYHYGTDLPDYRQLANYDPPVVTRLYADDGRLLTEYAKQKRVFVPIGAIPQRVIRAFLSAEDKNFYQHPGLDFFGIARAMIKNVQHIQAGRRPTGASTITQQVAKNFLLTNEVSIERKVKEAILAMRMEKTFSKDKILELYLNEIYLGGGSYGVAAAAMDYFNKSLDDLTVAEVAYLAALPKAPNNYSPERNYQAAIERRNWVIDRMTEDGVIKLAEARSAKQEDLKTVMRDDAAYVNAEYFAEEVRRELVTKYGESAAYQGGLTVRTTLDPQLQEMATRALRDGLMAYDARRGWHGVIGKITNMRQWLSGLKAIEKPKGAGHWQPAVIMGVEKNYAVIGLPSGQLSRIQKDNFAIARGQLAAGQVVLVSPEKNDKDIVVPNSYVLRQIPIVQGGIAVIDPQTGRILAMTGGFSHDISVYNRATQAMRQPGSSFKPFVYLAALEQGFAPNTLILDSPVSYSMGAGQGTWSPGNYKDDYLGPTTVRQAIEKSRNIVTVRTADYIGVDKISEIAGRFGITPNMPKQLAMALGAGETTVVRMAAAYAMLINGGKKIEPAVIDRVQDRNGRTIYRHDTRACAACLNNSWTENVETPAVVDNRQQLTHPWHAYQMVNILQGVVERGTATSLKELQQPLAGKTGTTNDSRDAWFVGASSDLVVAAYVGFDQPKSLGGRETGGSAALPIVKEFFKAALKDRPGKPFAVPPGISLVRMNPYTGERLSAMDASGVWEAFVPGTEPDPDFPQPRTVLGSGYFQLPG